MNEPDKSKHNWEHRGLNGLAGAPRNGWSFFKSPLFAAVVGQIILFACWGIGFAVTHGRKEEQWTQLTEWKKQTEEWKRDTETKIKTMNDYGTSRSHFVIDEQQKQISKLDAKIEEVVKDTSHFDVMEREHQRLTKDVEDLKNGRK